MTKRKFRLYRPRKRRVRKFKANPLWLHEYEAAIILRDMRAMCDGEGLYLSAIDVAVRYPGRYNTPTLNTAMKRMAKRGQLRRARTGTGGVRLLGRGYALYCPPELWAAARERRAA